MKNLIFSCCLLFSLVPSFALAQGQPTRWNLTKAVSYAIKNSPDTTIAKERIAAARATSKQATAGDYPHINLYGEYSGTNNPMYSFGNILNQSEFNNSINFNDPGFTDQLELGAAARYALYDGGQRQATKRLAAAEIERANAAKIQTEQLLAFEVVKNFQEIIQAQSIIAVQHDAKNALQSSLQNARLRYDAGDLLRQELLTLEAQLARTEENEIIATHTLALAKQRFLTLLGLEPQEFTLELDGNRPVRPSQIDNAHRLELQIIAAEKKAAAATLDTITSHDRPQLNAFANYSAEYGFELGGSGESWGAGVRMDYSLFDGHQNSAQIALAKAKLREITAQEKKLILALNLEITQAELHCKQAKKRITAAKKSENAAREAARLGRDQFKEGVLLATTLVEYENRFTEAQCRRIGAESEHIIAIANLRRASGYNQFENQERGKTNEK